MHDAVPLSVHASQLGSLPVTSLLIFKNLNTRQHTVVADDRLRVRCIGDKVHVVAASRECACTRAGRLIVPSVALCARVARSVRANVASRAA